MSSQESGLSQRVSYTLVFVAAVAFSLCTVLACARPTETPPVETLLRVSGSTSAQRLAEVLASAYMERNPGVTLQVKMLNSQQGIEAVESGRADVAFISRELRDDEARYPDTRQKRFRATLIAKGGIAVVVSTDNPVAELSTTQIEAIYTGEVWSWGSFGGPDEEIEVLIREEGSGTRAIFDRIVLGSTAITPRAIIMPSSQSVVTFVRHHPNAIGYVSVGEIGPGTRALRINGIAPSQESVSEDIYPLVHPLFVLTKANPPAEVQAFLRFVTGREGTAIIAREYAPVR